MNCLFCNIVKDSTNSKVVYEDNLVMVLMDIYPICDGHLLVIPKNHFTSVYDVDDEVLLRMFDVARKINNIVMKVLGKAGATFSINYGVMQEIKHLHLHIMPDFNKKPTLSLEEVYNLIMEGLNEKKN